MSDNKRERRKGTPSLSTSITTVIIVAVAAVITSIIMSFNGSESTDITSKTERDLEVRYIDVGQGDSTLVLLPDGKNMLIDAGTNSGAKSLVKELKNSGIEKIDYLIATHPHEDHIGGMDNVINEFEIGKIYMPKVDSSQTPTTKTYEDVLDAVSDKGLKISRGKGGDRIIKGENLDIMFVAPNSSKYSDLNSYSIAVKVVYGKNSFLFMGDAEQDSEKEIIDSGYNIEANVLKCGHHGSNTATSKDFVEKVSPKYAVISCGKKNSYGHPHEETLDTLNEFGVKIYRTDTDGTVTVKSDGSKITINTER